MRNKWLLAIACFLGGALISAVVLSVIDIKPFNRESNSLPPDTPQYTNAEAIGITTTYLLSIANPYSPIRDLVISSSWQAEYEGSGRWKVSMFLAGKKAGNYSLFEDTGLIIPRDSSGRLMVEKIQKPVSR